MEEALFTGVITCIEVKTDISYDLLQSKSNRKKATNDFVTNCFYTNPTFDNLMH